MNAIQLTPGPPGAPGPAGQQGPPGSPSAIKVYDADGQYLGILVNVDLGQTTIYIPSAKKVLVHCCPGKIHARGVNCLT
jgi:hypothetical protein